MSISPGSLSPAAKRPSAMPRSMPSATRRHSATPVEAVSCMLISPVSLARKSHACHETVMALPYEVVYYHRQLGFGKFGGSGDAAEQSASPAQGRDGRAGARGGGRDR